MPFPFSLSFDCTFKAFGRLGSPPNPQSRTTARQSRKRESSVFLFLFFGRIPVQFRLVSPQRGKTTSRTAFLYDFYTPKHACLNLLSCRGGQQAGAPRFFNGGVSSLNVHTYFYLSRGRSKRCSQRERERNPRPREMNVT